MSNELLDYAVTRLYETGTPCTVPCKICGEETKRFDVLDFNKSCDDKLYPAGLAGIPVYYRICAGCQFIFTDFFDAFSGDQWRRLLYNDDYAKVDPEYREARPRRNAAEIEALLIGRRRNIIALDYGGGNGLTATLLRQRGWTYDSYDPFGHNDMREGRKGTYNFCSAFEVFEHSPDPIQSLSNIVELSSPERIMVLIGTGIHDSQVDDQSRLSWWYAAPRNGHVSLYSRKSLRTLGTRCGLHYSSVSPGTHLLHRGFTEKDAFWFLLRGKVLKRVRAAAHLS